MKVLNIIWKFTTGGIGKCFLTYSQAEDKTNNVNVISACIDPINCTYDRDALSNQGIKILTIKNRKDFSWINKVYKLIVEEKPDIIFTHGLYGPIIIEVTKLFHPSIRKIPMLVSFHGKYNPPTSKTVFISGLLNNIMAWICKYRAKSIIIVSKFAGEFLLKKGVNENKLFVVYNGLSNKYENSNEITLPNNAINIVFAGRIDEIKGLEYLLSAIYEIKKNNTQAFNLFIIGDGPLTVKLTNLSKKFGIEDCVKFVGYKNNIPSWLEACDIFVLPSLQENHSIALLEAMRAGKAIICTNIGGNPETVRNEKEALLVPSKDSSSLKSALIRLLESEDLRNKLGENAKKRFMENFTEENTKKELIKTFIRTYEHSR